MALQIMLQLLNDCIRANLSSINLYLNYEKKQGHMAATAHLIEITGKNNSKSTVRVLKGQLMPLLDQYISLTTVCYL